MPKKSSGGLPAPRRSEAPAQKQTKPNDYDPRIPPDVGGIQVNFCKTPGCENFGVPPLAFVDRGRTRKGTVRIADGYRRSIKRKRRGITCLHCGSFSAFKSNAGCLEEFERLSGYLRPPEDDTCCPNKKCSNHGHRIADFPKSYWRDGKTPTGSQRYRCKTCETRFTIGRPTRRQRKPHENKTIFSLLVNKAPIRAIARVTELSPQTIYDKIDFIHRQCLAFVADRERQLPELDLPRLEISVDRQDYITNWRVRRDRRNIQLSAIGSAENRTGYLFGMHLAYEPSLEMEEVEGWALVAGDYDGRDIAFRTTARLWLLHDYISDMRPDELRRRREERASKKPEDPPIGAIGRAKQKERQAAEAEDPEAEEVESWAARQLPDFGIQVRHEYTSMGHFHLLRELVGHAGKIRFYMDQDESLRAACLATFYREIKERRVDAIYVQIDKDKTIDQRRQMVGISKKIINGVRLQHKDLELTDREIIRMLIEKGIREQARHEAERNKSAGLPAVRESVKRRDTWIFYPVHTMNEPDKVVCLLTDFGDYGIGQKAAIFARASLHGIDRFFMQLRRLVSLLERPIHSPSNAGKVWYGYSPYNPAIIQKLLDIYRVYYNYCAIGKGGKTPAMRLGLAKGKIRIEDILYFDPAKASALVEIKRPRIRKPRRQGAPMIQPRLPDRSAGVGQARE